MVEAPGAVRISEKLVLRIESKSGPKFISIHGNRIESMGGEPKLENAKKLTLNESNEPILRKEPMEPMKQMN
jgi:hypothetical protein